MLHKPSQNVAPSRRASAGRVCLSSLCLLLCLHVSGSPSPGQGTRGGRNAPVEGRIAEVKRTLAAPIRPMLKARGVPIDPAVLFEEDWRERIEPALAGMPEMSQTLRVAEPMQGVYLAGLVLLPERISLRGDTLILTRELAPDDENSTVRINGGHRLYIFNIGNRRQYEAMAREAPQGQFLNIDVGDSCVVVGIAPMYLGTYRYRGDGYIGGWKRRT